MVLGDSFNTSLFKQTWQKAFAKDAHGQHFKMAFNASFEVKVIKERQVTTFVSKLIARILILTPFVVFPGAEGVWSDGSLCVSQQEKCLCV